MDSTVGIPDYKLFIKPNDVRELRRDIWLDTSIPAQLKIEEKKLEIDLSYRGSHIRGYSKKSYQITFYKPLKYKGANQIHLNAEFKDPSLIRNKCSFDFFSEIGVLSPTSHHIFLSQNGKAEGVYLELESVDENFLLKRNLPKRNIYYAVDGDANFSLMSHLDKRPKKSLDLGYERKCGVAADDYYLKEFIFNINTLSQNEFEREIRNYLDIDRYLRWIAGIIFTSNYDGFVHNYALYRNGDSGLYEVIPWDYDATWGRDVNGKVMEANYVPIEGFNTLTARVLNVDHFREQYRHVLLQILNHQFTVEFMKPKVEKLLHSIRPYVLQDPYKKDYINDFDNELEVISKYIVDRRNYLHEELKKF